MFTNKLKSLGRTAVSRFKEQPIKSTTTLVGGTIACGTAPWGLAANGTAIAVSKTAAAIAGAAIGDSVGDKIEKVTKK